MKTQSCATLKLASIVVGVGTLLACGGGPRLDGEETDGALSPPSGQTNSVGVTNAPAVDSQPIAKINPTIPTSPGLAEIVKLTQAGVEESVLLAFVENSSVAYNPTADELVYLHDVGITPKVVAAIIEHGKRLRDDSAAAMAAASGQTIQPPPVNAQPPATSADPAATSPPLATSAAPAYAGYPAESPSYVVPAPVVVPEVSALPAQVDYFYDSLSPYGTWYDLPGYGWCWQPTVVTVQPAWRPYCDYGRWLYSDCGWYWHSDYSWGWAPFHYGRWFHHARCGWVWAPDTVWGPAWVSWRSSPLYCGWAPLPPAAVYSAGVGFTYFGAGVGVGFGFGLGVADFTFVPIGHFGEWNPRPFCLTPVVARNVFNQTIIVNNYIQGPNHQVINLGVDRNTIAKATRSEISTVTIRDVTPAAGKPVKPGALERNGSSLVVYRPQPLGGTPARPTGSVAYHRQELAAPVSAGPNPASPLRVSAPAASAGTLRGQTANTASGSASRPAIGPANLSTPRRVTTTAPQTVSTRPASGQTTVVARNQFGQELNRNLAAPVESPNAVSVQTPMLGRYPTQAAPARPPGGYYPSRTSAATVAPSWSRSEGTVQLRQEASKPSLGETRPMNRPVPPPANQVVSVRPSFYNPPPLIETPAPARPVSRGYETAPPVRSDAAVNYPRPAERAPAYYAPRTSYERPTYAPAPSPAPRAVYSQPQMAPSAPSYQPARPPSMSGGPISRTPTYSAPASSGGGRRNNGNN